MVPEAGVQRSEWDDGIWRTRDIAEEHVYATYTIRRVQSSGYLLIGFWIQSDGRASADAGAGTEY